MLLDFDKRSRGAFCVPYEEILIAEYDLCVGPRDALLHDYDLVRGVSSDRPTLFVQFVKGSLGAFRRNDYDFVLNLILL